MKKIVIILSLIGFMTSLGFSQDADYKDIRFGFQFSPTFSKMTTDVNTINSNGTSILGAKLGAVGEFYFRENYAITTGIGFAFNHSGNLKYDNAGDFWPESDLSIPGLDTIQKEATLKYNLQYVEIPVSLRLISGFNGAIRYYLEAPTLYIGINTQARGTITGTNTQDTEKENIQPDIRALNLSWGFGGGIEYEIGDKTSVVAGLFYQRGFTDVTRNKGFTIDDAGVQKDEKSKAVIGAFGIRLGVMF